MLTSDHFDKGISALTLATTNGLECFAKTLDPPTTTPSPTKISEIALKTFWDCHDYICEEETNLKYSFHWRTIIDLETTSRTLQAGLNAIKGFFETHKVLFANEPRKPDLDLNSEARQNILHYLDTIQTIRECVSKEEALKKQHENLSQNEKQRLHQFVDAMLENREIFSDDSLKIKQIIQFFVGPGKLLPENVNESIIKRYYLKFYLSNCESAPHKAGKLLERCFRGIDSLNLSAKEKVPFYNNAGQIFSRMSIYQPTFAEIDRGINGFISFSRHPGVKPEVVDYKTAPLLPLASRDPKLFLRFSAIIEIRSKNYLADTRGPYDKMTDKLFSHFEEYARYGTAEGCHAFLDLLEIIPMDASYALSSLFLVPEDEEHEQNKPRLFRNLRPHRIAKFDQKIIWIREELRKDSSESNKRRLSNVLDRVVVLFIFNPTCADLISEIPAEKYSLIETLLKDREDIEAIKENDIKQILEKEGLEKLSKDLFENRRIIERVSTGFTKACAKSKELESQLETCLNTLLSIQRKETENQKWDQKLPKLPLIYLQIIERMLVLAEDDINTIEEMLIFACKRPYQNPLKLYLDDITEYCNELTEDEKKAGISSSLQTANALFDAFPNLVPQLLNIKLRIRVTWAPLLKESQPLFRALIERHSSWFERHDVNAVVGNPTIIKNLLIVMEIESAHYISILEIFDLFWDQLQDGPLIPILFKHPDIALQIASLFVPKHLISRDPKVLITLLKTKEQEILTLFQTASNYPKAFFTFFDDLANGKPLDKFKTLTERHPNDIIHLFALIEQGHQALANQLVELSKINPELAHNYLDMAHAHYIPEVEALLKPKPDQAATMPKLQKIACSKHAPIISKILQLNPKEDATLLQIFLSGKPDEVTPLFANLMILRARNDPQLKEFLSIWENDSAKKAEAENIAALQAIADGRYILAKELIKNQGKPYLQGSSEAPSSELLHKWHELTLDIGALDPKSFKNEGDIKQLEAALKTFATQLARDSLKSKSFCSWAGKVQFLLQHNPTRALEIVTTKDWDKQDQNQLWDISKEMNSLIEPLAKVEENSKTEVEKAIKEGKEHEIKRANRNALTRLSTNLGVYFAHCLISRSGFINCEVIEKLLQSPYLKKLPVDHYLKQYIERVLVTFRDNPDFSERLASMKYASSSRLDKLLSKTLQQTTPIDLRLAKVAIISALLNPLRQELAGSCFGTKSMIQLASSKDGLKQLLEFYMMLVGTGAITIASGKVCQLVFDPNSDNFAHDNPLARAMEYTLSSISTWTSLYKTKTAWENIFSEAIREGYSNESDIKDDNDALCKITQDIVTQSLRNSSILVYDGHAKHSTDEIYGAWILVNADTHVHLRKPGELDKFFKLVQTKAKMELLKTQSKHSKVIQSIFEKHIPNFLASTKYVEHIYKDADRFVIKGLPRVNCIKYCHLIPSTSLESFGGGNAIQITGELHGIALVYDPKGIPSANPLRTYQSLVQMCTDHEYDQALNNTAIMQTVSGPLHAFNFKLGAAATLLQRMNVSKLWSEELKSVAALEIEPLTDDMIRTVEAAFVKALHPLALDEATHALNLRRNTCKNIRQLCDVLACIQGEIYGEIDSTGIFADTIENSLRSIPKFASKFPKPHAVFDTNWSTAQTLGFSPRIYNRSLQRILPQADNTIELSTWKACAVYDIEIYRYRNNLNDFARTYYIS